MSTIPEILIPFLEITRKTPDTVVSKYWHDTISLLIPPGFSQEMMWMPRRGYVLVLMFDVFGRAYPVDPDTLDIDTSFWYENTEAGFWHETADMRYHWDPLVSSLCDKPYPHFSVVTERSPYKIIIHNPTNDFIYFNITIHIWEMTEEMYYNILRPYLLGIFYFYWNIGRFLIARSGNKPLEWCLLQMGVTPKKAEGRK